MSADLRQTVERELKLGAGPSFELPFLPGKPIRPLVLLATYVDTSELALARSAITLRHRVERRKGRWQLKLPHADGRLEIEEPGTARQVPPQLRDLLRAHTRRAELVPIATLRTERRGVQVYDLEREIAEVVHDTVTVLEGTRVVRRFTELEIELLAGDWSDMRRIEALLREAGATDGERRPKVFQALDLSFDGQAVPAAADPAPPTENLRVMLERQYDALLAHDPGTRLGTDPEELHQMRVATRRMRALIRAGRSLGDMSSWETIRAELAWLARLLGAVRDHDVMVEQLEALARGFEAGDRKAAERLVEALGTERVRERSELLGALRGERYFDLLDAIEQALGATPLPVGVSLSDVARTEFRNLRRAVKALADDPEDDELHATRILGKRARYAAELAELEVGKQAADFIKRAKAFQDVVGEHQDAVVGEQTVRELLRIRGGTRTGLAAGRMIEQMGARRRAARAEFRGVWRALARSGDATWR